MWWGSIGKAEVKVEVDDWAIHPRRQHTQSALDRRLQGP